MRELGHSKFDLHITSVRNPLGVLHSLPCIGKEPLHLFFTFYIILAALITHAILIRQFFSGLDTKKNIMGFCILGISIVGVIGCHQRNGQLPAQLQKLRVDQLLLRDPVILQLQEIVALPKAVPVTDRRLSGLIDQPFLDVPWNLSCQAGRKRNDPLMIGL